MKLRLLSVLTLCLLAAFGCATDKNSSLVTRYVAELHHSVEKSWRDAVQDVDQARLKKGKVVVQFLLRSTGEISYVTIIANTAGPADKPWPEGMVQIVGSNQRLIRFQFNYK